MKPFKITIFVGKDGSSDLKIEPKDAVMDLYVVRNILFSQYKEIDYTIAVKKIVDSAKAIPKIQKAVSEDPMLQQYLLDKKKIM